MVTLGYWRDSKLGGGPEGGGKGILVLLSRTLSHSGRFDGGIMEAFVMPMMSMGLDSDYKGLCGRGMASYYLVV